MTPLVLLAEKVEGLKGPDREVDRDIALLRAEYDDPEDLGCFLDPAEAVVGGGGQTYAPPAYTASLDAAMLLVPADHTIQLSDWDHEALRAKGPWQAIVLPIGARGAMQRFTFSNRCDHAATPPLALCAAALRARAAMEAGE